MLQILLFVLGAILGSFLNVVILRYHPNKFLFSSKVIGGRSHCPGCGHQLSWPDLIPILSFIMLRGRCRSCGAPISPHYPVVEILSGLILVAVPYAVYSPLFPATNFFILNAAVWSLVFLTLLLITGIDLRWRIIPDEANIFLVLLGLALTGLSSPEFGPATGSLVGNYALLFGLRQSWWLNRLLAVLLALVFFGFIVLLTRGRGMGLGDVKLAGALALVFGWPEVLILSLLAFMLGSLFGIVVMLCQGKTLRSFLPFGPFLSLGAALVFFFGHSIFAGYFGLLGS